ncbi:hypothetical protein [Halolamina salifodinae]|uniref:Tetrahydromethanopterin S-methyltransferase subunit B n=1 Tax=Halolamina salifodinae TaxID=1202767 RepID=A0A8T4GXA7_9EURY|nr:hypothetical protein [Halolamina salifodinae]MBP1986772.1 tetrahydromethanopterin S-methyltransferase subunit B [Halolamina salifodinae]
MDKMTSKICRIGIVALLLVSLVGAPFLSMPVRADSSGDSFGENLGEAGCQSIGPFMVLFDECDVEYGDVDGGTPSQIHWDVYSDAVFMEDSRDQHITEQESFIGMTEGMATAHAKETLIECRNAGKSQSVCEDKARQEVDSVFAEMQKSIYISQNRQIQHWKMMEQQVNQTDNLAVSEVYPYESNSADWETGFREVELTLYNGESMNVTKGYYKYISGDGGDTIYNYPYYYNGKTQGTQGDSFGSQTNEHTTLNVISPEDKTTLALEGGTYKDTIQTIDQNRQDALSQVHPMANDIWANYEVGEVSSSETQCGLDSIATSATNDEAETYRVKSAYCTGLAVQEEGKDVEVRADFDDDGESETKSGVIIADPGAFPDNTFKSGVTYNGENSTATTNGSVSLIATSSGEQPQTLDLTGEKFTITAVYGADGKQVESATLSSNEFTTTSTEDLNNQINEIDKKLEAIEKSYNSNTSLLGGGGVNLSDSLLQQLLGGGIVVLIIGALVALAVLKVIISIYLP